MTAKNSLDQGDEFPYDAGKDWWEGDGNTPPPPPDDWAHRAARGVLADLTDRKGVKNDLEDVDYDTRGEIVAAVAEIIRLARGET